MIEVSADTVSIGGDTFNAASMAAVSGVRVEYTTRLGTDEYREQLSTQMSSFPLELKFIQDSSRANGKYFISNDKVGERTFRYERENSAASALCFEDFGDSYLNDTDALFNSGITMALSQSLCKCTLKLYEQARSQNVMTFFDVNYREKLWDLERASVEIEKVLKFVDYLFISEDDLELISRIIKNPLNDSSAAIIERKGSEGCVVHFKKESTVIAGVKVSPIDTTGAGDVFTGSFIAHYLKTKDLVASATIANKMAARHTEYQGGTPKEGLLK